jgi:hypothetical protein
LYFQSKKNNNLHLERNLAKRLREKIEGKGTGRNRLPKKGSQTPQAKRLSNKALGKIVIRRVNCKSIHKDFCN